MELQYLTPREKEIMGIIWRNEGDISEINLKPFLHTKKENVYARTTLSTFLMKLKEKGFISKYRNGRESYVHAEVTVEEYILYELQGMLEQFCGNDKEKFKGIVSNIL